MNLAQLPMTYLRKLTILMMLVENCIARTAEALHTLKAFVVAVRPIKASSVLVRYKKVTVAVGSTGTKPALCDLAARLP